MRKKISRLGSFSNDGLSIGLINIEFSEEDLEKMRKIISADYENIEIDLKEQLHRLDKYLKDTFGVLFRNDDFVTWFFEKKKINQFGRNLPKIKDEELIEYSRIYLKELNIITKNEVVDLKIKIWNHSDDILIDLANSLKNSNSIENEIYFIDLFLKGKKERINWLKNKTTLIYLISKLKLNKFIDENISENSFIEKNFYLNGKKIKNIKQSKEQMSSTPKGCQEIDLFINTYKNTLPQN